MFVTFPKFGLFYTTTVFTILPIFLLQVLILAIVVNTLVCYYC